MSRYDEWSDVSSLTRVDINRLYYAAVEAKILWQKRRQEVQLGNNDVYTVEECSDMIYLYRDLADKMYWMDESNKEMSPLSREVFWNEEKTQNDVTLDYYYSRRQDGLTRDSA